MALMHYRIVFLATVVSLSGCASAVIVSNAKPTEAFPTPLKARSSQVVFVDIQRAMAGCAEGRKARAALIKIFDGYQEQLEKEQAAEKKAIADLNKERAGLPAEVVRQREAELQAGVGRVQAMYQRDQKDIKSREEVVAGQLTSRIKHVATEMLSDRHLTVIFDKSLARVLNSPDITGEMIHRLNANE